MKTHNNSVPSAALTKLKNTIRVLPYLTIMGMIWGYLAAAVSGVIIGLLIATAASIIIGTTSKMVSNRSQNGAVDMRAKPPVKIIFRT